MGCFVTTARNQDKKVKIIKNTPPPKKDDIAVITTQPKLNVKIITSNEIPKINAPTEKISDVSIKLGSLNSNFNYLSETKHNAINVERVLTENDIEVIKNILHNHFLFKEQYDKIMYIASNLEMIF